MPSLTSSTSFLQHHRAYRAMKEDSDQPKYEQNAQYMEHQS